MTFYCGSTESTYRAADETLPNISSSDIDSMWLSVNRNNFIYTPPMFLKYIIFRSSQICELYGRITESIQAEE